MINTRFWNDSYIAVLDPIERLLFLYLLTNSYTNICGIYEIPLKRMAFDIGIDVDVVRTIMQRFESDEKILYRNGWVAIKNFIKHQATSPKVQSGINYELQDKPKELVDFVNIGNSIPSKKPQRKQFGKTIRKQLLEKFGNKCAYCGSPNSLEIDHIRPLSVGGTNDMSNLQILCSACNGKKNANLRWDKNGRITDTAPIEMGAQSHLIKSNLTKSNLIEFREDTPSEIATHFFENPEIQTRTINDLISNGIPELLAKQEMSKFVSYWTEPTSSGKKQRWQTEKTFELNRRLSRWFANNKNIIKPSDVAII